MNHEEGEILFHTLERVFVETAQLLQKDLLETHWNITVWFREEFDLETQRK